MLHPWVQWPRDTVKGPGLSLGSFALAAKERLLKVWLALSERLRGWVDD